MIITRLIPLKDKAIEELTKSKKAKLINRIQSFVSYSKGIEMGTRRDDKKLRNKLYNDFKYEYDRVKGQLNKETVVTLDKLSDSLESYIVMMEMTYETPRLDYVEFNLFEGYILSLRGKVL